MQGPLLMAPALLGPYCPFLIADENINDLLSFVNKLLRKTRKPCKVV